MGRKTKLLVRHLLAGDIAVIDHLDIDRVSAEELIAAGAAAVLNCRLIDRPLRPSFPDGYRNETQVVITVIGADQSNPHDVVATPQPIA